MTQSPNTTADAQLAQIMERASERVNTVMASHDRRYLLAEVKRLEGELSRLRAASGAANEATEADARDAARYRWLRAWHARTTETTYLRTPSDPWVARQETRQGTPAMCGIHTVALDAAIDAQLSQPVLATRGDGGEK